MANPLPNLTNGLHEQTRGFFRKRSGKVFRSRIFGLESLKRAHDAGALAQVPVRLAALREEARVGQPLPEPEARFAAEISAPL